ncbi:transcription termination/antitermination NusG family protein [Roseicyclus sp. F158]|uniref:Transcription termination/antitermination NusG family protein n=1 Tax=Tropicimonas omnivorans TaxID=3075590 RepID=A0ABU3DDP1_9RHOB|nr:transcription termination/antitermination NusG family protein [Roseicyclus sp. F158]MDT0681267.1 transcription termination/antitermination NusG family protein [Roseicyclus sp. F158]
MFALRQHHLVEAQWHLALCKPNQHKAAQHSLERIGCDVFIPRHRAERRWRGKVIAQERPIFAGYIFFAMDPAHPSWPKVKSARGVSRVVTSASGAPAIVPPQVVAGLMARCDPEGLLQPEIAEFGAGDTIRIVSGPFADFVTSVESIDSDARLHVLLDLLGRPTRVKLDPASTSILQD